MSDLPEQELHNGQGCGIHRAPEFMPDSSTSPVSRIFTRTRRRAMDWSLVLASQGIEHMIEHSEATGWALTVAERDHQGALDAIRLYRLENRHWRWRQPVFQPDFFFDWRCTVWALLTILFYWASEMRTDLRDRGMMNGAALSHGEWWRLFTATWLHADAAHLAMNLVFGWLFLGLVMGRFGPGMGLLAAYLAGVGGNLATWLVYGVGQRGLGASGVVMGALGLLAVPSLAALKRRDAGASRLVAAGLLSGLLLLVLLGMDPGTDVVAHGGGFIAGILVGLPLVLLPPRRHRTRLELAAGILYGSLIIWPWLRALT